MTKYEYPIYGKKGCKFTLEIPEEHKDRGYCSVLEAMGYSKKRIGDPYHYLEESDPCVEILCFSKDDGSIVEIWDHSGSILNFYCVDENDKLELLSNFILMMKNIISVEYMNRRIYKEEEEAGD